jgi:putative hydrolase of the HAD superfamily
MLRERITDIFFDLDHTLWDFETNSKLTFERIFNTHNVDVPLEGFLEIYVPLNLAFWKRYRENRISKKELRYQRLRQAFDALSFPIEDTTIHKLSKDYIRYLSSYNNLINNTVEVLSYLNPRYALHIITNGFEEIQEKKLTNGGIRHFFNQVVNSEMAGVKKPHPGIFQLALERAGVTPEVSLMIGDNLEADILGAKAVGFHALHFNAHNDAPHDHCPMIQGLIEIKSHL